MAWGWPGGARLALSLVVNVEEGAEFNVLDGDRGPDPVDELGIVLKKPVRNYGNETNYAYGINEGAPRVLALLERYTLEVLREQVDEGVLDFEHAHHPRHLRFAWHLRDVLTCKGSLPQGTKSQKYCKRDLI